MIPGKVEQLQVTSTVTESVNSYKCRGQLSAKKYTKKYSSATTILWRNMNIVHLTTYRRIIISEPFISAQIGMS